MQLHPSPHPLQAVSQAKAAILGASFADIMAVADTKRRLKAGKVADQVGCIRNCCSRLRGVHKASSPNSSCHVATRPS